MGEDKIASINKAITAYFKNNPTTEWIPVKLLMPMLIESGVFHKDIKKGLPLRNVLRGLDKEKTFDKIPSLHAERKGIDTYWYFVREGSQYVSKDVALQDSKKEIARLKREASDEYYLIGLCNDLLKEEALHQHIFKFLLGDYHSDGVSRTSLPVDAYYPKFKMVVELFEKENETSIEEGKETISGVKRSEQRKKYAERKRNFLKEKEIHLIEMDYDEFEFDDENRLVRNKEADVKLLKEILKGYLN
ncbi:hypothetical protein N9242_06815 [Vicingaceae bacterium]|nr:hypothetical protein [Vicingaceae bacterium]